MRTLWFSLLMILITPTLPAQAPESLQATAEKTVIYQSRNKLRRGLTNTATGWLEIPYKTFSQTLFGTRTPFEDLFVGLTVGTVKAVERTAVGLFETATFLMPSYDALIDPEYVTFSFEPVGKKKEESDPRAGLHVRPPTPPKP
jgi:putative exosortase-associated protein (TIGR04073 family)